LLSTAPLYVQKNVRSDEKYYRSQCVNEIGSLKLIVPVQDSPYEELYIYSKAEQIFEYLAG